jgi:hypothetical protein
MRRAHEFSQSTNGPRPVWISYLNSLVLRAWNSTGLFAKFTNTRGAERIMTKAVIWFGALVGAIGGGYLGYVFAGWLSPQPGWGLLIPVVSLGVLIGAFIGSRVGFIAAGLLEQ